MDRTPCKSFQRDDLEVTRNPFDSRELDKENLPAFSPSIFIASAARSSEKKNKSFRWSIDQIAALKPAEIDEFPNQEYSASYEREEDEIAVQNAINEYFSKVTLPSPWTRNKDVAFKRVTFSPNPPTYFKETSYDSNKSSKDSSLNTTKNGEETRLVDCSCQTVLTIPPNFNLEKLLGDKCFVYNEPDETSCKELNISTLRRKLFSQGEQSPIKDEKELDGNNNQRLEVKSASSTPRTPRTPNWITSSPFRDLHVHGTPLTGCSSESADSVLQSSFVADPLNSPVLSPIKDENGDDIALSFTRIDSPDSSFELSMLREDKLVSSDLETSMSDRNTISKHFDTQRQVNTMSVEPMDSIVDVKESTRLALIEFPGFSPIKNEEEMDMSVVSSSKYEYDIRYNGNSVKESTANHIHGITGLFSPINRNKKRNSYDDIDENEGADVDGVEAVSSNSIDDGGPLDITDLSLPQDPSNIGDEDEDGFVDVSDEVFQAPVVIVSPYPAPKRGILKHTPQRGRPTAGINAGNNYEHRFEDLEEKLSKVEDKIDDVKSICEKDIREIKRNLTPARKPKSLHGDGTVGENQKRIPHKGDDVSFSRENLRPFDSAKMRVPLKDRTNGNRVQTSFTARNGSFYGDNSAGKETIIQRGYSALNRAKSVQRKIDEDFDLCLNVDSKKRNNFSSIDNDDAEAAEVASILTNEDMTKLTHEGERNECFSDDAFLTHKDKYHNYRLTTVRESLNDSWDLRSKGAMDIGEMDSSVLSTANGNCRTPTPIMNLAGLTLYNGRKENSVPMSVPRPLLIDRKWTREGGKIERRHTWPCSKPTRYIMANNNRSLSPQFPTRHRSSKSSLTKLDFVNKIKEELKIRPSSRTIYR